MIQKKKSLLAGALLAVLLGAFSVPLFGQHRHGGMNGPDKPAMTTQDKQPKMIKLGKNGKIAFDSPVRVGEVLLEPGTYQIQHVMEGEDHVIVFRKMSLGDPLGYEPVTGKAVARVKCRIEPLGEKAKHDGMRFGTNAAGEKTVEEVHVKGENVKHLF